MKTYLTAVLSLFILSAEAAAETGAAAGDLFTGARAVAFSLESFGADIPKVSGPAPVPAPEGAPAARLSQAEKESILLAIDPEAWTAVSDQPYAGWWMPRKFRSGAGGLTADVLTSVMGGRDTIPLRRAGELYEYGPWYYCHGSLAEERCIFRVRVRFEVVSATLLRGTLYSQWELDGTQAEHSFMFRKK